MWWSVGACRAGRWWVGACRGGSVVGVSVAGGSVTGGSSESRGAAATTVLVPVVLTVTMAAVRAVHRARSTLTRAPPARSVSAGARRGPRGAARRSAARSAAWRWPAAGRCRGGWWPQHVVFQTSGGAGVVVNPRLRRWRTTSRPDGDHEDREAEGDEVGDEGLRRTSAAVAAGQWPPRWWTRAMDCESRRPWRSCRCGGRGRPGRARTAEHPVAVRLAASRAAMTPVLDVGDGRAPECGRLVDAGTASWHTADRRGADGGSARREGEAAGARAAHGEVVHRETGGLVDQQASLGVGRERHVSDGDVGAASRHADADAIVSRGDPAERRARGLIDGHAVPEVVVGMDLVGGDGRDAALEGDAILAVPVCGDPREPGALHPVRDREAVAPVAGCDQSLEAEAVGRAENVEPIVRV